MNVNSNTLKMSIVAEDSDRNWQTSFWVYDYQRVSERLD